MMTAYRKILFTALLLIIVTAVSTCAAADAPAPAKTEAVITVTTEDPTITSDPDDPSLAEQAKPVKHGLLLLTRESKNEWGYGAPLPNKVMHAKLAAITAMASQEEVAQARKNVPVMEAFKPATIQAIGLKAGVDFMIIMISEKPELIDNKKVFLYRDPIKVYRISDGSVVFETTSEFQLLTKEYRSGPYESIMERFLTAAVNTLKPYFTKGK